MEQIILKNILPWIKLSFRDHQLSADPTEMKQLVNFFRDYKKLNKS